MSSLPVCIRSYSTVFLYLDFNFTTARRASGVIFFGSRIGFIQFIPCSLTTIQRAIIPIIICVLCIIAAFGFDYIVGHHSNSSFQPSSVSCSIFSASCSADCLGSAFISSAGLISDESSQLMKKRIGLEQK